jgi:hypothetical protein
VSPAREMGPRVEWRAQRTSGIAGALGHLGSALWSSTN